MQEAVAVRARVDDAIEIVHRGEILLETRGIKPANRLVDVDGGATRTRLPGLYAVGQLAVARQKLARGVDISGDQRIADEDLRGLARLHLLAGNAAPGDLQPVEVHRLLHEDAPGAAAPVRISV